MNKRIYLKEARKYGPQVEGTYTAIALLELLEEGEIGNITVRLNGSYGETRLNPSGNYLIDGFKSFNGNVILTIGGYDGDFDYEFGPMEKITVRYSSKLSESLDESYKIENERVVSTGLSGNKNEEILDSVIGQLSDGIWENSPRMDKYWEHAEIRNESGNVVIVVDGNKFEYENGFRSMTDDEVRKFFANKIKQIIKIEIEDGSIKGEWARDNMEVSSYMGYKEEITVSDCYKAYEILLGRNISGRYSESYYDDEDRFDDTDDEGAYYITSSLDRHEVAQELKKIASKIAKKSGLNIYGDYYYYNGNDGTDFDWEANGRTCEVRVENEEVDFQFYIRTDGVVDGFAWPHGEQEVLLSVKELGMSVGRANAVDIVAALFQEYDEANIIDEIIFTLEKPMAESYAVIRTGGSIGEIDSAKRDGTLYNKGGVEGIIVKKFEDPEEAKKYAQEMRKSLTPGEKKYYGMGYKTIKVESYDGDTYHEYYKYDREEELLYLFPNEGAFVDALSYLNMYDLTLLGRNLFEDGDNLVVRGKLKDLEEFAYEVLAYELHPNYLYKEDEFGGSIIDLAETDDTDMYDESIAKKESLKEGSVSVEDVESALASLKEIEYDVNEIIEDDNGNIEVSCTSPDAKQRIKNRLKRAFPNNKVELRGLFSVTLFNESKSVEESVGEEFKPGDNAIYRDAYGGEIPVTIVRKASLEDVDKGSYKYNQMLGAYQGLTWYVVKYYPENLEDGLSESEWVTSDYRLSKANRVEESKNDGDDNDKYDRYTIPTVDFWEERTEPDASEGRIADILLDVKDFLEYYEDQIPEEYHWEAMFPQYVQAGIEFGLDKEKLNRVVDFINTGEGNPWKNESVKESTLEKPRYESVTESLEDAIDNDNDYQKAFSDVFNKIEVTDGTYTMRLTMKQGSPYYGYFLDDSDIEASEHGEIEDLFPDYMGNPPKSEFAHYKVVGTDLELWEYVTAVSDYLFYTILEPESLEDEETYPVESFELGKKLVVGRDTSNDNLDWDAAEIMGESTLEKQYMLVGDMEDHEGTISRGVTIGEYGSYDDALAAYKENEKLESPYFNLEIVDLNNGIDEDEDYMMEESIIKEGTGNFKMSSKGFPTYVYPEDGEALGEDEDNALLQHEFEELQQEAEYFSEAELQDYVSEVVEKMVDEGLIPEDEADYVIVEFGGHVRLVVEPGYYSSYSLSIQKPYDTPTNRDVSEEIMKKVEDAMVNAALEKAASLAEEYGLRKIKVSARFSSGETWYNYEESIIKEGTGNFKMSSKGFPTYVYPEEYPGEDDDQEEYIDNSLILQEFKELEQEVEYFNESELPDYLSHIIDELLEDETLMPADEADYVEIGFGGYIKLVVEPGYYSSYSLSIQVPYDIPTNRGVSEETMTYIANLLKDRVVKKASELALEYGLRKIKVSARFSSGETWYNYEESKKRYTTKE